MELMKIEKMELANKELAKSIMTINKAVVDGNKSTWVIAREFARITTDELFEDDFENKKQFAECVGISPSYLSQCVTACEFVDTHKIDTTVNKAYILSRVDDYEDFDLWCCDEFGYHAYEFGDNALKDIIKKYEARFEEASEEVVEEASEEVVEEIDDAMEIMVMVKDEEGNTYNIPLAVLNQYRA